LGFKPQPIIQTANDPSGSFFLTVASMPSGINQPLPIPSSPQAPAGRSQDRCSLAPHQTPSPPPAPPAPGPGASGSPPRCRCRGRGCGAPARRSWEGPRTAGTPRESSRAPAGPPPVRSPAARGAPPPAGPPPAAAACRKGCRRIRPTPTSRRGPPAARRPAAPGRNTAPPPLLRGEEHGWWPTRRARWRDGAPAAGSPGCPYRRRSVR